MVPLVVHASVVRAPQLLPNQSRLAFLVEVLSRKPIHVRLLLRILMAGQRVDFLLGVALAHQQVASGSPLNSVRREVSIGEAVGWGSLDFTLGHVQRFGVELPDVA